MGFDDVVTGSNLIFDKRSSVRSRDHMSFDVIDALANRADLLEIDGLGTNAEKKHFSTSRMTRRRHAAGTYGEPTTDIDIDRSLVEGNDLT